MMKFAFLSLCALSIVNGLVINSAHDHTDLSVVNGLVIKSASLHTDSSLRTLAKQTGSYDDPCTLDSTECQKCSMANEHALTFLTPDRLHLCTVECETDVDCPTNTFPNAMSKAACLLENRDYSTKYCGLPCTEKCSSDEGVVCYKVGEASLCVYSSPAIAWESFQKNRMHRGKI